MIIDGQNGRVSKNTRRATHTRTYTQYKQHDVRAPSD